VDKYNGVVPRDRDVLMTLSGVGRKTANVFLSEYYNDPYIGVDTHVERVSKRLKLANKKDSVLDVELKLQKKFDKKDWAKRHLQLVLFGRYKCKSIKPMCSDCELKDICIEKRKS
jgi:endonuclease-3